MAPPFIMHKDTNTPSGERFGKRSSEQQRQRGEEKNAPPVYAALAVESDTGRADRRGRDVTGHQRRCTLCHIWHIPAHDGAIGASHPRDQEVF